MSSVRSVGLKRVSCQRAGAQQGERSRAGSAGGDRNALLHIQVRGDQIKFIYYFNSIAFLVMHARAVRVPICQTSLPR